jgi:S-formylglutathione hydrolase FrmB
MKKHLLSLLALLLAFTASARAFTVEPHQVPSPAMKKSVPINVILPAGYASGKDAYPVLYLLHGYTDDQNKWIKETPIGALADQYQIVVVCPGVGNSWYFDSPEIADSQYETFMTKELVPWIDHQYRTRTDRTQRAIAGNSMGGHGALFLAIRHRDLFSIVVSLSGAQDFRPFPEKFNLRNLLGPEKDNQDRWTDLTVVNQAKSLKNGDLAISIDCGESDFLIQYNRDLHQELLALKIDHDYTERPGKHGWPYWSNAIKFQMLYIWLHFQPPAAKPAA